MEEYHKALCNEIRHFVRDRPQVKTHPIQTIFLGGGTPSLYPPHLLKQLFALLHEEFNLSNVEEISLEVNPGGQTEETFQAWKECGITRLSVGVQVLDEEILKKFKRFQADRDVNGFFAQAPRYFSNMSADMIIGLPGVTQEVWKRTIETALTWPIQHFSLYFLTVHEHTPLYYGVKKGAITLPKDEQVIAQYEWTIDVLERAGFAQYEISNFARRGYESRHNAGYWQRKSYKGFGLGAASYDGKYRFSNIKKLGTFLSLFSSVPVQTSCPYATHEQLSQENILLEMVMLGLRQREGVSLRDLHHYMSDAQQQAFLMKIAEMKDEGFVDFDSKNAWLTRHGILYENEVVARLCHALDASG